MATETEFVEQLEAVRAAWQSCRRHLFQNTISSRPRSVVFAEMDAAADVVVEAIVRLAALAITKEQQAMVAEIDQRFGGAVRDEANRRRRNVEWLSRLSPLDGGSVDTPG